MDLGTVVRTSKFRAETCKGAGLPRMGWVEYRPKYKHTQMVFMYLGEIEGSETFNEKDLLKRLEVAGFKLVGEKKPKKKVQTKGGKNARPGFVSRKRNAKVS